MDVIAAVRVTKEGPKQGHIIGRLTARKEHVLFLEKGDPNPYWCDANDVHERITTIRYCEEN